MDNNSQILIYQTEDGQTKIETRMENETVWLTIDQMAELFQNQDRPLMSISSIFTRRENW